MPAFELPVFMEFLLAVPALFVGALFGFVYRFFPVDPPPYAGGGGVELSGFGEIRSWDFFIENDIYFVEGLFLNRFKNFYTPSPPLDVKYGWVEYKRPIFVPLSWDSVPSLFIVL